MQQATRTGEIGPVAAHSHIMVIIYKWSNIAKTSIMLVGNPHRSPGLKMSQVPLSFCVPIYWAHPVNTLRYGGAL